MVFILPMVLGSQIFSMAVFTTSRHRYHPAGCALGLMVVALLASGGCSTFNKAKASHDRIVQSRQLTQKGVQAIHRNDWENAAVYLAEAKQFSPYDVEARTQYAETLWRIGKQDEAIAELEEVLSLANDDPAIHTRLGRMYLDRGDLAKAQASANQAIRNDPKHANAWMLLGDLDWARDDIASAKLSYIRAANHSGAPDRDIQLRLASAYRHLGQPNQSLACISLIHQSEPGQRVSADVGVEQALAMRDLGRHQEAGDRLAEVAESYQLSADVLFAWAECEVVAGRLSRAEFAAQSALRVDPQHAASRQLVAELPAHRQKALDSWRR